MRVIAGKQWGIWGRVVGRGKEFKLESLTFDYTDATLPGLFGLEILDSKNFCVAFHS
jgi:hypothetical protein